MGSQRFNIVTAEGQEAGFIVIDVPEPSPAAGFQHVAGDALIQGPIADLALLAGSLTLFTGFSWYAFGPGVIAPLAGVTITAALAALKIWRGGPPAEETETETPAAEHIRLEVWAKDDNHAEFHDLDKKLKRHHLDVLPKAIYPGGRPNETMISIESLITQGLSQNKARQLLKEMKRLNLAVTSNNNKTVLTMSGKALARRLSPSPSDLFKNPFVGGTGTDNRQLTNGFNGHIEA